jgi:hypothetical protein
MITVDVRGAAAVIMPAAGRAVQPSGVQALV